MAVHMQSVFGRAQKFERLKFTRFESIDASMCSTPFTPKTPLSPQEYEIHIATANDKEDILDFLRTFFLRDEPLNKSLGLISDEKPRCPELEDYCVSELDNGVNLKAVHNGKIIGVCLNSILEPGYLDAPAKEIKDKHFRIIYNMLGKVDEESDIFAKFPGSKRAISVKIVSVNEAYRGQGIAKELMAKTKSLGKEVNASFISVICTSHFTALAVHKLGLEKIYSLKYSDYKINGVAPLKPAPPHEAVTVYVQKLE